MKQETTFTGKTTLFTMFVFLVISFFTLNANAQLINWNANGLSSFGPSPWNPENINANLTTSGLVRGSSIATGGSSAASCWGGSGGWNAGSGATTDNNSFHFTVVAQNGYSVSLSSIGTRTRRSNSGPSGYTLYYSVGGGAFASAGSASTTSTGGTSGTEGTINLSGIAALQDVAPGTVIKFRINPTGSTGNYYLTGGAEALEVNGTVQMAVLAAPVATDATGVSSEGFTANWEAVAGATGYRLDVATDNAFTDILENYDNLSVTGLSKEVTMGIQPDTPYYYRVRAENSNMTSDNSNIISVQVLDDEIDAPVATAATAVGHTGFTANWNAVPAATGYYLDVSISPTFDPGESMPENMIGVNVGNVTSYQVTGLENGTTYYYRVRAYHPSATSVNSNVISTATTLPLQVPIATDATAIDLTGFTANWDAVDGADGYYLDISTNADFSIEGPGVSVTETFTNIPMGSSGNGIGSYDTREWTGDDGTEWQAFKARTDKEIYTDNNAIGLQNADGAYILSGPISGGISRIQFEAQQLFTTGSGGEITVTILSGEGFSTSTVLGTLPYNLSEIAMFDSGFIEPITGDYKIRLDNNLGARVVIDNLIYTSASSSVPDFVAGFNGLNVGNVTSYQVTGLEQGVTYYYRVKAYNNAETTANSNVITVETLDELLAPVATDATDIASTGFTANWDAVASATGYRLDVSTMETFGTTIDEATITETFENLPDNGANIYTGQFTGEGMEWDVVDARTDFTGDEGKEIVLKENGSIESGVIEGGLSSLEFKYYRKLFTNGQVKVSILTGTDFSTVTELATLPFTATAANFSNSTLTVNEDCKIRIENVSAGANIFVAIDNLVYTVPEQFEPSFVEGYENLFVAGTSQEVTGVAANTTYYYRVRAERITETSLNSNVIEVTTDCNAVPVPTVMIQEFCGTATVADLSIGGTNPSSWYTDEAATEPLTGDTALATGTYYVTQTINGCESPRAAVEVTVNELPAAPVAAAQVFCGSGTVSELEADIEDVLWYADETSTEALTGDTVLTTDTYYVAQIVGACESARAAVEVTVNELPAAPVAAAQVFCGSGMVGELEADIEDVVWYADETTTEPLTDDTILTTGTYYVAQIVGTCESPRAAVEVTVNELPVAPVAAAQVFCGNGTVGELEADIEDVLWYADETSTEALADDTVLTTGTYYVAQIVGTCESPRAAVEVTVNELPAAPVAAAQVFCGNGTVGELEADIEDVLWYADETSTEVLADDTVLSTGTYYVAQLVGTCESARAAIEVTVNAVPDAPTGSETQQFTAGETLADLEVAGTNVVWYEDEALTIVLADTTPLVDQATYYAAQVEGECISDFLAVTVSEIMATDSFTLSQLQFYPNPVKNELNLSFAGEINTVSVFNMLGQVVADKQVNATDCKVDLSHLQAGTYLVRVMSGKGERTIKIVKD